MSRTRPIVLSLSGHDPTGGAGIQADIETIARFGCHPCTVVTALTVQDTRNVRRVLPQPPEDFLEQARALLADLPVAAVKIGLLGSVGIVRAVEELLAETAGVPVVLDPILAAGGGRNLAGSGLIAEIKARLIPRAALITPNTPEARTLSGMANPDECAAALLALGCPNVLLTGTHEDGPDVVNRWYRAGGVRPTRWPRLSGSYHGSGCTLASAVAAGLARGDGMERAVAEAQRFTWEALNRGWQPGQGQLLPDRSPSESLQPPT
jgi:hydroxymethylpyrimidine/phosphomethylpyrimidine kinase